MFIVQLKYKAPLTEVNQYLSAHREFLDYYYKQGLLIASGPMSPRTGGIIIATGKDKTAIEAIFQKDPFYLAEIADYQFIEFSPIKHCDALKNIIEHTEGKLC